MAGYAGVGKSTVAAHAIEELKEKCKISKIRTAAYTGKAASVLRRKGVAEAQTIHSLIYAAVMDEETGELTFKLSDDSPAADADLIVLDECSMVDERMANDLRYFGKKILIMGDPGQLPPIHGAGAFTSREPDIFLKEIHRQAADSPIIELATMAREGKRMPIGYNRDGVRVLKLTKETQELVYAQDAQPICGLNRVRWVYTQRIRARLGFSGERPVAGERILCCKNNRQKGFYNGSVGELISISDDMYGDKPIYLFDVDLEDTPKKSKDLKVDPYLFRQHFDLGKSRKPEWKKGMPRFEEFDWGYVLTCHKAQGSSWQNVTVIDDSETFRDDRHKWLYTAATRAEEGLTILIR